MCLGGVDKREVFTGDGASHGKAPMNTYRGEMFAYGEERGVSVLDKGGAWRQHVEDVFGGSSRGGKFFGLKALLLRAEERNLPGSFGERDVSGRGRQERSVQVLALLMGRPL
ncbi:hypothetical protein O93_01185 [Bartonella quintana JK 19]|nr:hypothetical protein O93_01185 [Bartonella quintana JK 19]